MATARALIAANPAVADVIQVSGFNILNGTSASNGGFISIMLKDWRERAPLDEVMGAMQRQLFALPEATIMTFAPPALPELGNASGFDLRILAQAGQRPAELEQVTRAVLLKANQHPQLNRVFTTWSSNVPQLTLTVDRAGGGGDGMAVPRRAVRELDAIGKRHAVGFVRHRWRTAVAVGGRIRQRRVRADWPGAPDSPRCQKRDPDRRVCPRKAQRRDGHRRCLP